MRPLSGGLFVVAAILLIPAPQTVAAERERPNVLFLLSDDQRYDTIRALGNEHIQTPHLDKLVQRGFVFTNTFCMGSMSPAVCLPSRAMLMAGRTLFHTPTNLKDTPILPEVLRQSGYATFGTGKWHNGPSAYARGFTHGGAIFYGGMSNHLKVPIFDFHPAGRYPAADHRLGSRFSSELFADAAIEFLTNDRDEKPFFMYVAFTAPHDPRMAPDKYRALYDPETIPLPESFLPVHPFNNGELRIRDEKLAPWPRTPEIVREHTAEYYAMITHMDAQIGRILAALEASGQAENTIVVFSSDHGLAVGRHGLLGKQNLYDHSIRPPLIFAGPGVPEGRRSDALCYLFDIFPTLCELCGLEIPRTVEGRSLAGILHGEEDGGRDVIFGAYRNVQRMIRTERWKLIRYPQIHKTQLFDLRNDPHELHDLAMNPDHSSQVRELLERLERLQRELDDDQPLTAKTKAPLTIDLVEPATNRQTRRNSAGD